MADDSAGIQEQIDVYGRRYGIDLGNLSEWYDLHDWVGETIPNASSPGCYFIFNPEKELVYIGKASLGSTVGRRVASYFFWDKEADALGHRHEGWSRGKPRWLRTLSVPKAHQAASLEEFLIEQLQPCDNTRK